MVEVVVTAMSAPPAKKGRPLTASFASILLEKYDGDKSQDQNYFQGNGKAIFKDGHVYEGSFEVCLLMS